MALKKAAGPVWVAAAVFKERKWDSGARYETFFSLGADGRVKKQVGEYEGVQFQVQRDYDPDLANLQPSEAANALLKPV